MTHEKLSDPAITEIQSVSPAFIYVQNGMENPHPGKLVEMVLAEWPELLEPMDFTCGNDPIDRSELGIYITRYKLRTEKEKSDIPVIMIVRQNTQDTDRLAADWDNQRKELYISNVNHQVTIPEMEGETVWYGLQNIARDRAGKIISLEVEHHDGFLPSSVRIGIVGRNTDRSKIGPAKIRSMFILEPGLTATSDRFISPDKPVGAFFVVEKKKK